MFSPTERHGAHPGVRKTPLRVDHVSLVNMVVRNVAEAKTTLSALLDAAMAGEEVIIARAGTPLVRLVPVTTPASRELGFLPLHVEDEVFAPLEAKDLAGWQ